MAPSQISWERYRPAPSVAELSTGRPYCQPLQVLVLSEMPSLKKWTALSPLGSSTVVFLWPDTFSGV